MIVDRDDIYGNGVNVAARLESLADAGGICVSGSVVEQVQDNVDVNFEDMGPQAVKNIAKPVQSYRVVFDRPSVAIASSAVPDKPSIAVLPFDVIGGDPQTNDLADGLIDELITALAKVHELRVIARHSAAIYKNRAVSVESVAADLGVRYVLEGSIRTFGDRLRCAIQLVDTARGQHLWAERYDRQVEDIFALQDEIVWHILLELQVRLTEGDSARIASRGTRNLQAWLLRVQGAAEMGRVTRESIVRARELFEAAHRADPDWARPLACIAYSHYFDARFGWTASCDHSIKLGFECAERALVMDPQEPFTYMALRGLNVLLGQYDKALAFIEKGVTFAPNDHLANATLACQLAYMDETDRAIQLFQRVFQLAPTPHKLYQRIFGVALQMAGRTDQAIAVFEDLVRKEPGWLEGHAQLAAAYADAGRDDKAQATAQKILQQDLAYTASRNLALLHFQNPGRTEWMRALLVKAGLPE